MIREGFDRGYRRFTSYNRDAEAGADHRASDEGGKVTAWIEWHNVSALNLVFRFEGDIVPGLIGVQN